MFSEARAGSTYPTAAIDLLTLRDLRAAGKLVPYIGQHYDLKEVAPGDSPPGS